MISVRCHQSSATTLAESKLLLDTHDLFRLPQHVNRGLGESDDRCLVNVVNNLCNSVQQCIQGRGTLGPLGQSFLKQGKS